MDTLPGMPEVMDDIKDYDRNDEQSGENPAGSDH